MDVTLRGFWELQINDMLDNPLIQEYLGLLKNLDIPEESRSSFLIGYLAGRTRSRLNACSFAMSNRPLNRDEIEVFSEILGRRRDYILGKILDQGIENHVKEGSGIEEPRLNVFSEDEENSNEEKFEEVPLKTVATIGNPESEEVRFSFKISGKK